MDSITKAELREALKALYPEMKDSELQALILVLWTHAWTRRMGINI